MEPTPPNWVDIWSLVISAATLLAIALAAVQLLFHSRQMHREFESLYVARYWELMDKRSERFVVSRLADADDKKVISQYLQLCEDEVDLRRRGRLTDNTWYFWSDAIFDQCTSDGYREMLEELPAEQYPGVRRLIEEGGSWDPLGKSRVWRIRHGL